MVPIGQPGEGVALPVGPLRWGWWVGGYYQRSLDALTQALHPPRVGHREGLSATLTSKTSVWRVLLPSTPCCPLSSRQSCSFGERELDYCFWSQWGHTSGTSTHPLPGLWVVVWLLILTSRTLACTLLGTHVAGCHLLPPTSFWTWGVGDGRQDHPASARLLP